MALRECNECGKDVSSSAKSCPHCGYDGGAGSINKQKYIKIKRKSHLLSLLLTALFGGLGLFYVGVWSALLLAGVQIALLFSPAPDVSALLLFLTFCAMVWGFFLVRVHNKKVEAETLL